MKYIITIIYVISFNATFSQTDIIFTFNSTGSGRSIILIGSKNINKKHEIGIGIRYNVNKLAHSDDQFNTFFKRQFATRPNQHWGLETFYHHYFLKKEYTRPFLFYDLQVSYSKTRNRMFLPVLSHEELGVLYKEITEYFGPFSWIEQCIGIGFKAHLFDQLFIYQKLGMGITFILGEDEKLPTTIDKWEWEYGCLIQAGLIYRFGE